MKKIKENSGFTLLEIIISIAALSVMSIFILEMFLTSANLNSRAMDVDVALTKAVTELERFKNFTRLSDYLAEEGCVPEADGPTTLTYYFNAKWEPMGESEQMPEGARYSMNVEIAADDSVPPEQGVSYGKLYTVSAKVADEAAGKRYTLAVIQSKKYFPSVPAAAATF